MHISAFLPVAVAYMVAATTVITLDVTKTESIKSAAKIVAHDLTSYYSGDQPGGTPGLLPEPYYWWEAGGMFGTLIDYWHYTGDSQYNAITSEAMIFQASPDFDYMPANQSKNEGNDDQIFWGFTVMMAAEYGFPNPPPGHPSWVAMAQAIWNSQLTRWDESSCGGGLKWQIHPYNVGWNYKNTASNAGFMNLGARLYAYTGNETYRDHVRTSWMWMESIGLISPDYFVYDGSDDLKKCAELDHTLWSYNAGMVLHTAAVIWNKTENVTWQHRVDGVWNASSSVFFNENKTMFESACEPHGKDGNCDLDQQSFKAYYSRFLAASIKSAPYLHPLLEPYLVASASAAASTCLGGETSTSCSTKWTTQDKFDGLTGVGQQLSALQIIIANLVLEASPPVTAHDGGISIPDSNLGNGGTAPGGPIPGFITQGEKIAGICVLVAMILWTVGGGIWLVTTF